MSFEWFKRLQENPAASRMIVLFDIFILHIYKPMKRTYEQRYGALQPGRRPLPFNSRSLPHLDSAKLSPSKRETLQTTWHWRGMPKLWPVLHLVRKTSSLTMIYVILREILSPITHNLDSMLHLAKPIHCYLVGRFVLHPEVGQTVGLLFALYHMGWRYIQEFASQSMVISTIYFMLLDKHDIQQYYKLLAATNQHNQRKDRSKQRRLGRLSEAQLLRRPPDWQEAEKSSDDDVLNLMHDIMSFRVSYANCYTYKLRPNRTLESRQRLQATFMIINLVWFLVFMTLVLTIATAIMANLLNVRHYLQEYRNCSPQLERQIAAAKRELPTWSMKFVGVHQYVAYLADSWENVVLWSEGGIVAMTFMTITYLLNYDLHLYWRKIDLDISDTLELLISEECKREEKKSDDRRETGGNLISRDLLWSPHERNQELTKQIFELQMEVQDFVKQVAETNKLLTDCYGMILTMWYTLFAYNAYKQFNGGLPTMIIILMVVLLTVVTSSGTIILTVQRGCKRSYTRLCSLMAHDQSRYKKNFIRLIEYYVKGRTCFTVYRGSVLKSTTLLTLIGYSFSCFFIVGSMYYR